MGTNSYSSASASGAAGFLRRLASVASSLRRIRRGADRWLPAAQTLVELYRVDEAEPILGAIKLADQDALYQQVLAQLELKKQAEKNPELEALEQQLEQDPDNLELAHKLAVQLNQEGYHRQALELLYDILRKDLNHAEGQSKKALMDIIASLGKGDPLAAEFQRKLFTLLY